VGSVVVAGLIAVVLANMSDSSSKPKAKGTTTQPGTTVPGSKPLTLTVGKVIVQTTGPAPKITRTTRRTLLASAQHYVDGAILAPLERGKVNTTFANAFDAGVRTAAIRTDASVLTEGGTGKASGAVIATATPVRIDVLGDPTGKLALAAATFKLNVKAATPKGRLTIQRNTELTFANVYGKWFVTAYRVTVLRTVGAKTSAKTITSSGFPSGVSS
jgi:hypothetical protein